MKNGVVVVTLLGAAVAGGCATQFSAQSVRAEIVRQTGEDPQKAFEINLGPVTMALARQVLAGSTRSDGTLPLAGLTSFELAVYGAPAAAQSGARPLDFSAMPVRGWEPTLRMRDGLRSGMVLVRADGEHIGDLVMLAGGDKNVIFARLRGTLSRDLPAAIGEAVKSGSTEVVQRELQSLAAPQQ
jgi:hypothetical protein